MKKIILTATLAVAVGVTGFAISNVDASQVQEFNGIKAYTDIGKYKTKDKIEKYKKDNEIKINKLQKEIGAEENILVTITFKKPLNKTELTNLVNDHNLNVIQIHGRAITKDSGLRATIGVSPLNGEIFDETILDQMLNNNHGEFKGFIELVAEVPNKNIKKLKSNAKIYLVDPSADNHLTKNPKKDVMPGLYWSLEDNGMVVE